MMTLKRGDTQPVLRIALTDGITGLPVDLSAAVGIRVIGTRNTAALFDRAPDPYGPGEQVAGIVTMSWHAADTETTGVIEIEVEVTWVDTTIHTFPGSGSLRVQVEPDLG